MKVVLLAGGLGTRISEETVTKPKPMVEIAGRPVIWHIMKYYSTFGLNDFIICLGYKGYMIKEYFHNYQLHMSDVTISTRGGIKQHTNHAEDWNITLVDTGQETMTGGRIKRLKPFLENEEAFCLTYGDGLANVDLKGLTEFHQTHGKLATLTAVPPIERFGVLDMVDGTAVRKFMEKPQDNTTYINGGFFVLSPKVLDYIEGDDIPWEKTPLETIAQEGQLQAFKHHGFWQCMDTLRDKNLLEELWRKNEAPWHIWS